MLTGDKAYRKAEISSNTAYSYLAKDGPARLKLPSVPRSRSKHQHMRLGNRNACNQNRPGPKHALRRATFSPSEPRSRLLGGFVGRISPKRHPAPAFPQFKGAGSEQPPPKTAQKPRTRRSALAGKATAAVSANASATHGITGARQQAKQQRPMRM